MNMLKNILFFGLLLAVLCGVYLSLNRSPEQKLPDFDKPQVKIDMGRLDKGPAVSPVSGGQESNSLPSLPPQPPITGNPGGGTAPPYIPPVIAGQGNMAPPNIAGGCALVSAPPDPSRSLGADLPPPPATPPGDMSLPPPPATPPAANPLQNVDTLPPPPARSSYPSGVRDPFDPSRQVASLTPSSAPPPSTLHAPPLKLEPTLQRVKLLVGENKLAEALFELSQVYDNPDLPSFQAKEITHILDQMAARVIYSREHLLERPYRVRPGDTLDSIADNYQVPALLLAHINGVNDQQPLPAGKELKVLKGPFSAQISTDHSEMTLMLDGRYAGRFPVSLSDDVSRASGMWTVRPKIVQGSTAANAGKPYLELRDAHGNGGLYMRGTNDTRVTTSRDNRNSIWLSEQDMSDVFGILSAGSNLVIHR